MSTLSTATGYLIKPTAGNRSLRASFLDAMREFEAQTGHADAGGLSIADLEAGDCFESYCKTLQDGTSMRPGTEPLRTADYWWCEPSPVGDVTYLGRASLRHHVSPSSGANLDYAIRPSRYGQGHDAPLLAAVLPIARSHGINPVIMICDDSDIAARDAIEECGGIQQHHIQNKRRYLVPGQDFPRTG
jgi:predicted acetyltransferase